MRSDFSLNIENSRGKKKKIATKCFFATECFDGLDQPGKAYIYIYIFFKRDSRFRKFNSFVDSNLWPCSPFESKLNNYSYERLLSTV